MKTSILTRLVLLGCLLVAPLTAQTGNGGAPLEVNIVRPTPAPTNGAMTLPARTAPAEEAFIYARATGTLAERRVDLGDRVNAGDLLATVSAPEIAHQVARAQAALSQSESRLALAQLALERSRALVANGGATREEFDERETSAQAAAAEVEAARAEMDRLEAIVSFQQIRAPFAGVIAERRIDRGDRVAGDQSGAGAWLFHLVRVDELRVQIDAPPALALALANGAEAQLTFPEFPGERFTARVARTTKLVDRASGTMRVELVLPNADLRLPAGLTGTASFSAVRAAALVLPVNSLVVRDGQPMVALVENGVLRFAPVQTGRNLGQRVEILAGLTSESQVVLSPNALLREGDSVKIALPAGAAAAPRG